MLLFIIGGLALVAAFIVYTRLSRKSDIALDPNKFQGFKLIDKITVSHDTSIFRFALHHDKQTLGLPIGQHIAIRAMCQVGEKSEMVQHSYTPITCDDDKGYVDFMIKVYMANVHPKFPLGGRLSQHMNNMKIGDSIDMRGPQGKFEYKGHGLVYIRTRTNAPAVQYHLDAFVMVAGGTGITPLLQIMRAVERDPTDKTKIYLVYGNQTEKDILLRKELDGLVAAHPDQVKVWYTVDRDVSLTWKYDQGYVSEDMFRKHLKLPDDKTMALMCGPPLMMQHAIKPNLEKMGYKNDMIFSF